MASAVQQHRSWYKRPLTWVVAVILIAFAIFGVREAANRPPRISYGEFLIQLDASNIANVTFAGTQVEGNFKHSIAQAPVNGTAAQTTFRSQVPDFGDPTLLPQLRKQKVPISVTSSSSYWFGTTAVVGGIAAILLAKPMLLVIGAAFIAGLFRVARGGKIDIHSMLAMVPMFRSVSDHSSKQKDSAENSPSAGN